MDLNPVGKEWMGWKKPRNRKAYPSGGFKFKKSGGANSSASRFGMDSDGKPSRQTRPYYPSKSKPQKRTMEYRFDPTKPKRGPIPAIAGPARQDYIDGKKKLPRNLGKTPVGPKGGNKRAVGQRVPRIRKGR